MPEYTWVEARLRDHTILNQENDGRLNSHPELYLTWLRITAVLRSLLYVLVKPLDFTLKFTQRYLKRLKRTVPKLTIQNCTRLYVLLINRTFLRYGTFYIRSHKDPPALMKLDGGETGASPPCTVKPLHLIAPDFTIWHQGAIY